MIKFIIIIALFVAIFYSISIVIRNRRLKNTIYSQGEHVKDEALENVKKSGYFLLLISEVMKVIYISISFFIFIALAIFGGAMIEEENYALLVFVVVTICGWIYFLKWVFAVPKDQE